MLRSTIRKRTFAAIYRLLDRVSPVPFDCGMICGAACCMGSEEEDFEAAGREMGIYLLPGEEKLHDRKDGWLSGETQDAEEIGMPASWKGKVRFLKCPGPESCHRAMRPLQCRTFPAAPHFMEDGRLVLIWDDNELPYCCPLIEEAVDLDPRFLKATWTAWRRLVTDPLIRDLVQQNSDERAGEDVEIVFDGRP